MFRPPFRSLARQTRAFASQTLLSTSWEKQTVVVLRNAAKERGLSSFHLAVCRSGNKAVLVDRIRNHEKSVFDTPESHVRHASTGAQAPVKESVAPGIPPAAQPSAVPQDAFLYIRLPDIPSPNRLPPIQIPVLPDLWDAESTKAAFEETKSTAVEDPLPKLLVVGGTGTYPGEEPSLSAVDESTLSSATEDPVDTTLTPNKDGKGGLLDDVTEDLGVPYLKDWRRSVFKLIP